MADIHDLNSAEGPFAGGGRDIVKGTDGNDDIAAGANKDRCHGGEGDDHIKGNGSNDKLYGDGGNDTLDGGAQDDRVYGGDGNDIIIGGNGNDVLYGDNANDGNDHEGWADVFVFDSDDGTDKVFDFEAGIDRVELTEGGTYSLAYSGDNTILTYGSTTVTFYDEILTDSDILVA